MIDLDKMPDIAKAADIRVEYETLWGSARLLRNQLKTSEREVERLKEIVESRRVPHNDLQLFVGTLKHYLEVMDRSIPEVVEGKANMLLSPEEASKLMADLGFALGTLDGTHQQGTRGR